MQYKTNNQTSTAKPVFTKVVKEKETETTKWNAKEKTITSVDLDDLLNDGPKNATEGKKPAKPLFKKRTGKIAK